MTQERFHLPAETATLPDPQAVYTFARIRFTLLTARFIRIEISPKGQFEDRPSQQFWYRAQPLPKMTVVQDDRQFSLETETFKISYRNPSARFNPKLLQITITESGTSVRLDDANPGLLPGTARTLDEAWGPVHLKPGVISRSGWVQLDDTPSLVFNPEGWLEKRPALKGYRDLYLLISGSDYPAALQDYQRISGRPPLLPRAFLGNWWSRYWEYSTEEIKQLVKRFEDERIPLSVFIIDMDWHTTRTGNASSGWTGFSWNRELFPDPAELLTWLHQHRLLTSLNLHPAEGIHPHEDQYPAAAAAMGLDPASRKPVPFDIADPHFAKTYFDLLLHPLEEMGVDFWWVDWQQGEQTRLKGLDPLWWLNHLHFYDLMRNGDRRPIIFSRWGGPGNQRYPIGFSGDTFIKWEALAFQPYFTASAANTAYGWWSHDIGGHMGGIEDPELYTRWVQFGVISPIFRLHSTKNAFIDRAPWGFDANTLELTRSAMQFRQALMPYLYSMARRDQAEGLPLVTPLYYETPAEESSYLAGGQYLFGSELMAAPVVTPMDPDLQMSRQVIWFPPGEWFDFFTGEHFSGPQWRILYHGIEDIPLYARAGAIVPLQNRITENGAANPDSLDMVVFPGKDGHFRLYEDDGVSLDYIEKGGCVTGFSTTWSGEKLTVRISPAVGNRDAIPRHRTYRILLRGVSAPVKASATLDSHEADIAASYDAQTRTACLGPIETGIEQTLLVEAEGIRAAAEPLETKARILRLLHRAKMETDSKWRLGDKAADLANDLTFLKTAPLKLSASHLRSLIETATGAGAAVTGNPGGENRIVLINPEQRPGFRIKGKSQIKIEPQGSILGADIKAVEVDAFGILREQIAKE